MSVGEILGAIGIVLGAYLVGSVPFGVVVCRFGFRRGRVRARQPPLGRHERHARGWVWYRRRWSSSATS